MVNIAVISGSLNELYQYQSKMAAPYRYPVNFDIWEKSFLHDIDGEGRTLFKELTVKGAYQQNQLVGFIQYGRTAFGFDDRDEISSSVSYPIIRAFYFDKDRPEAGRLLLSSALEHFQAETDMIYAFFHYFGMSCYAWHGKLFENCPHISDLLLQNEFQIEHQNVIYVSGLNDANYEDIAIRWHEMSAGRQQYGEFLLDSNLIGECEIHYLEQPGIAYLRWIYVKEELQGKGIGTKCMRSLKQALFEKGIRRLDTDTALTNIWAQRFYEKNGFVREGISRSFYIEK